MRNWLVRRLESILDNLIFAAIVAGSFSVGAAIKSLPLPVIIGIFFAVFVFIVVSIRLILAFSGKKQKQLDRGTGLSKEAISATSLEILDAAGPTLIGKEKSGAQHKDYRTIDQDERTRILDSYLNRIIAIVKQLPFGYLPDNSVTDVEIDDIYVLPHFSSQGCHHFNIEDERLEREIIRRSHSNQEKHHITKRHKPLPISLFEVIQSGGDMALIGYMGTGKSMAANYIALRLAKGEGQQALGLSKIKLPVLLHLGKVQQTPSSNLITFAIESAIAKSDQPDKLKQILLEEWDAGNVLLILDALDEFRADIQWISEEIGYLNQTNLNNPNSSRVLLTSRPNVFHTARLAGLKAFDLEELERQDFPDFIYKWTFALTQAGRRVDINPLDHATSLAREIDNHQLVEEIASNQLLLTILTILSLRTEGINLEDLNNEAQLFDTYIKDVIKWQMRKEDREYDMELLRIGLAYAGLEAQMVQSGLDKHLCDYSVLKTKLSRSKYLEKLDNPSQTAESILEFWLNTALIQESNGLYQTIGFRHQGFQFFAAALALMYQSEKRQSEILSSVLENNEWDYVLKLYFELKAYPHSVLE